MTLRIGLLVLGLCLAGPARAAPIDLQFLARVTSVTGTPAAQQTVLAIAPVGSLFGGSFRYDSDTPLQQVTTSNFHIYSATSPIHDVFIDLADGLEFRGRNPAFSNQPQSFGVSPSVANHLTRSGYDAFLFDSLVTAVNPGDFPGGGVSSFTAEFALWDEDSDVFDDPALPSELPLSDFEIREFQIRSRFEVLWTLDAEVVAVAVPEPGAGWLLVSGVTVLLYASARSRERGVIRSTAEA